MCRWRKDDEKDVYIYICRYTYIYKKMMNMCLPFSLAFVYGEHIASCAYVSCAQDKRRWIAFAGRCPVRLRHWR